MEKLKPRAVIFDLGSTLIEYESSSWAELSVPATEAMRQCLLKENHDVPGEQEFFQAFEDVKNEFRKEAAETLVEWTIPKAAQGLLGRLEITAEDGLVNRLFEAYYKPVGKQIFAYDDTLETLEKIRARVDVIGLVSNTIFPEETHLKELKRFRINKFFDFTIFSSTFGVRKPHPDIFYHAANMAGCAPGEAVYIGDRYLEDYQGPTGIGMPAVLKLWPRREYPEDMPDSVPTIRKLSELANYLDI